MKILSAEQIREIDQFTIRNEPVKSIDLMERAAEACFRKIRQLCHRENKFMIFCGTGNNGGDGLAIARKLIRNGSKVKVVIVLHSDSYSEDFQTNLRRLKDIPGHDFLEVKTVSELPDIQGDLVLIDALFGTGLNRSLEGLPAEVVKHINESGKKIIAIDMPSGLFADQLPSESDVIVKAGHTLSFQVPRFSFFFPSSYDFTGDWSLLDIGLSMEKIKLSQSKIEMLDRSTVASILKERKKFDHKGKYGHALLCSGSLGKIGAAVLAAKACLRGGAGLLTVHVPGCGTDILQVSVPEAMVETDPEGGNLSTLRDISHYNAIGIGPGCGQSDSMTNFMDQLLTEVRMPMVLDADALNIISDNQEWLKRIPSGSILTPHRGEFRRLAGEFKNDEHCFELQKSLSEKYGLTIVLKGAHTCITSPEGLSFFNSTGNPGMARGGSGDALCGLLLGLMAQGYDATEAARLGVYLHGYAGDLAAKKKTVYSMSIPDLIDKIPMAFKFLKQG